MIEDDARKRWCPMVREAAHSAGDITINRGDEGNGYNCIASDCMMWFEGEDLQEPTGKMVAVDVGAGRRETQPEYMTVKTGRCGLAK